MKKNLDFSDPLKRLNFNFLKTCTRYDGSLATNWKEGRKKEMFYLTTHSTHFIYGYMASDIWLRTILIVRKETRCRHIGYSFRLTARVLLCAPSDREDNTYHGLCYTSRGALAGTRNSSMGSPGRIDPTTHRTTSERSYATSRSLLLIGNGRPQRGTSAFLPSSSPLRSSPLSDGSSVVREFAHGVMGRRIDPSWGAPIELYLVPAPW